MGAVRDQKVDNCRHREHFSTISLDQLEKLREDD